MKQCIDNEFDNLTEEGDKLNHDGDDTEIVEVIDLLDCDLYLIRYWNNFKVSETQEELNNNYIEEKLKQTFKRNNVKDSDQVFKVFNVKSLDDDEIQVKMRMRKINWTVELSARNLQTSGEDISVLIKTIKR